MAKVNFVKKARKDYPEHGIAKGDYYYWWQNYGQPAQLSKTMPRRSQTIGSEKLSRACAVEEQLDDAIKAASSVDDIVQALNDAAEGAREIAEEYEDSASSIRESFTESPTADECEDKAQQLNDWADALEAAASEIENFEASDYEPEGDADEQVTETEDNASPSEEAVEAMMEAARDRALEEPMPL